MRILKRYDEALDCFDKAIEIDAQNDYAWYSKGLTLDTMRRYDEAIACYDRAFAANPQYTFALTSKGLTLNSLQKSYDEVMACFKQAIAIAQRLPIAGARRPPTYSICVILTRRSPTRPKRSN